jgi:hypothetical protein
MKFSLRSTSYANVTATAALVVALSGVGYAASALPHGSVGTAQLKGNAVISAKVKNHSLTSADVKKGQWLQPATLPHGKTETGFFGGTFPGASGNILSSFVSLPVPVPGLTNLQVVQDGDSPTTECPGSTTQPKAKRGWLCVYVGFQDSGLGVVSGYGQDGGENFSRGAVLYYHVNTGGDNLDMAGTWAVTAN